MFQTISTKQATTSAFCMLKNPGGLATLPLVTSLSLEMHLLPPPVRTSFNQWRASNPGRELLYYSDATMRDYVLAKCEAIGPPTCRVEAFALLQSGAARADFFRMVRLACDGGIWFDADMAPSNMSRCMRTPSAKQQTRKMPGMPYSATFFRFANTVYPRYDLMAANPGHPIIRATLRQICEKVLALNASGLNGTGLVRLQPSSSRLMGITGPHVLQCVICNHSLDTAGRPFVKRSKSLCSYGHGNTASGRHLEGNLHGSSRFGDFKGALRVGSGVVDGVEPKASFLFTACPAVKQINFLKSKIWRGLHLANWRHVNGGLRRQ